MVFKFTNLARGFTQSRETIVRPAPTPQNRLETMRPANRGDVPAPHVPPGAGKSQVTGGNEVIFDSGSLSFVKDWVEGADDTAADSGVEPARSDPRPKPNRRLGVGAKPKHPKREQVC